MCVGGMTGRRLTKWVTGEVTARERKLQEQGMRGDETIGRKMRHQELGGCPQPLPSGLPSELYSLVCGLRVDQESETGL